MNKKFDDWFHSLEGYHLLSERFYSDLDLFAFYYASGQDQKARETKEDVKKWLMAAFEAGSKHEKKTKETDQG